MPKGNDPAQANGSGASPRVKPVIILKGQDPNKEDFYHEAGTLRSNGPRKTYSVKTSATEEEGDLQRDKRKRKGSDGECMQCMDPIPKVIRPVPCDVCDFAVCFGCSKLSALMKEVAQEGKLEENGITWLCRSCKVGLPRLSEMNRDLRELREGNDRRLVALETRVDKVESTLEKVETSVEKVESALEKVSGDMEKECKKMSRGIEEGLRKRLEKSIKDEVRAEVERVVKGEVDREVKKRKIDETHKTIVSPRTQQRNIETTVQELRERDEKKPNMIIFNVPEPQTNLKEHRMAADKVTFISICKSIDVELKPEKVYMADRLGKKREDGTRPMLIKLTDHTMKGTIFKNTAKLTQENNEFKNISMTNDLTKLQREQNKKLREEAKDKTEAEKEGKYYYKVVGPPWARKVTRVEKAPVPDQEERMQEEEVEAK